ncbi:hypothetical protein RO3G_05753 [Rhizopus delemar RA 99-880]|uniref:Uncharacterized protein n=1 Tax=Rhizopus delemar (strain RA 99-880 / ATCC MYA-4621 / FGSC 9543 / NRRL 43880) TaxID=246409 RepID=I1BXW8_RHIO9|nr:hypothetical protein RO3G_05753 [Rhizopus delemar RA 99-880]|eukprot:EIE81048.1 hypothetical protein RO3G_05753 [Rhizopus delemar RA 99-880]
MKSYLLITLKAMSLGVQDLEYLVQKDEDKRPNGLIELLFLVNIYKQDGYFKDKDISTQTFVLKTSELLYLSMRDAFAMISTVQPIADVTLPSAFIRE